MLITGGLLMFYDSYIGVIFWQWVNQSFNAIVNYTNRSGDSKLPLRQLLISYILATGGALATALSFNQIVVNAPHLVRQCVPFVGVAAANCINIPLMRFQELKHGIPVVDDLNRQIGISKKAAFIAICSVVCSRMVMVLPGLTFSPIVVHFLEDSGYIKKEQKIQYAILQTFLCGFFLALATPMACAVFSQRSKISIDKLEQDLQEKIQDLVPKPELVFYNKGL
uniref:Uncharacterized protein n=1 Tax=Clastoptera arizonana TaxID=38151 RepID=A0A1B6C7W0_9HEMI